MTEYLADKSVVARMDLDPVRQVADPLVSQGLMGLCEVTHAEMLFSARNLADFDRIADVVIPGFEPVPVPADVWQRVREVQRALAVKAQHRCASVPDLVVTAVAIAHELTVLHYDRDFETIAKVTGLRQQWIVPAGTVS